MANNKGSDKSLESWIWDAACSIRRAKDAPKYKDCSRYIHTSDAETYRPIGEFVEELNAIEAEASRTDDPCGKSSSNWELAHENETQ